MIEEYRRLTVIEERYRNLKEAVYEGCSLIEDGDKSRLYISAYALEIYLRICDWERYEAEMARLREKHQAEQQEAEELL